MVIRIAALLAAGAIGGAVPGAHAFKACAAAGPYWPTMTLALDGRYAWVACKEESRLVRLDTRTAKVDKVVRLNGLPIAVAAGAGAVWALDSGAELYRVERARVTRRVTLGASAAYNLWLGGGSVWVADDQGASVIRVSTAGRILARVPVGDGPSDIAFSRTSAFVLDHRDRRLFRIDLATNKPRFVAALPGDAPERMVLAAGSLWVTGRGTDLIQVDPATGNVRRTIEIGASGIDVVAAGGSLWVPTRSDVVDPTGFPTMDTMKRVSIATGRVTTVSTSRGRVDVHGLVARGTSVWLADNTAGRVYRFSP